MDSKMIEIANCKRCKKRLWALEYAVLIRYYYQTAKGRGSDESMDRPAGHPADYLPNWDGLADFH